MNADIMKGYLSATGNPPALRSMIADDLNDAEYSVFAKQALTAKSWHVPNYASTRTIFNTAIQNVLSGRTDAVTALEQSQAQVTQLLQQ